MTAPVTDPADLSVVVPTYNERGQLDALVATTFEVFERHRLAGELIIVDDNSPDGTGELADTLAKSRRIIVVHRPGKLGLGSAVLDGFRVASSPIVGVMDGDRSHPPELLPRMLALIREGRADFVIGSRYIPGGGTRDWTRLRLFLSKLACVASSVVTPVRDATSGFFLLRRSVADGAVIKRGGFKICLELLIRGSAASVAEVPYVFGGRTVGQSKMNLVEATGFLKQLLELFTYKHFGPLRRRHTTYQRLPPER
jgi:dolichol-phosphate mannosyltransferase